MCQVVNGREKNGRADCCCFLFFFILGNRKYLNRDLKEVREQTVCLGDGGGKSSRLRGQQVQKPWGEACWRGYNKKAGVAETE